MKAYMDKQHFNYEAYGWMALFSFEFDEDVEKAEYYSLKCLEMCKMETENEYSPMEDSLYRNMIIYFSTIDDFEKITYYMREKFRRKYPDNAEEWLQMVDNIPMDEEPDEIHDMIQAIIEFEASKYASAENNMEILKEQEAVVAIQKQSETGDISSLLDMGKISDN